MRFFYENGMGDSGYYSEKHLVKAIYTAWNIEANLYLLNEGIKKIDTDKRFYEQIKIVFAPYEENELNTELLKEFGYRMEDGEEEREIINIKTGQIEKYDWSEVKQLI